MARAAGEIFTMLSERGPMANRGRQFSEESAPRLQAALARASATLRMIQAVARPASHDSAELRELRLLDKEALDALRQSTRDLLTDLRAELRRRGQF
jgi:hypothetical protein